MIFMPLGNTISLIANFSYSMLQEHVMFVNADADQVQTGGSPWEASPGLILGRFPSEYGEAAIDEVLPLTMSGPLSQKRSDPPAYPASSAAPRSLPEADPYSAHKTLPSIDARP